MQGDELRAHGEARGGARGRGQRWLRAAEAADAEEDKTFGANKSGEELLDRVGDKKKRAEKRLRRRPNWRSRRKRPRRARPECRPKAEERRQAEGPKKPGKPAALPSEEPDPKAQTNFTDPESRIMKTKDGFIQGYNAQVAVDATARDRRLWPRREGERPT